jgi:hypothetical protein
MTQEEALRKLAIVYDVRAIDNAPGHWNVLRKGGPPYRSIGIVAFRAGRLIFASKSWGPAQDNPTADALASALHDAVESLSTAGHSTCELSVMTQIEGSVTVFACGRHRLSVFAPKPGSNVAAGITESVSESPR